MPAKTISEKQRLANIANAQKSTGPKTIHGKSSSRRNSLKTGLSGNGVCLPNDLKAELDREIAIFNDKLKPADPFEARLVERAALASVRLNRINAQREQILNQRRRQAVPLWDQDREAEVNSLIELLFIDARAAVARLRALSEGCDALADQWDVLKARLQVNGQWLDSDLDHALRLLGELRRPGVHSPDLAIRLWRIALALNPKPDYRGLFILVEPPQNGTTANRDLSELVPQAKAALIELIDSQIQELQTLGDHLWETIDQPDRQNAPNRCLVDDTPEGLRLNRLESDADRQMHRNLKQLESVRREARETVQAQNEAILPARKVERSSRQEVTSLPRAGQFVSSSEPDPQPTPQESPAPARMWRYPTSGTYKSPI